MEGDVLLSREELLSCLELGKTLTSELEPEKLYSIILTKLSKMIPAHNWSLLLVDEETGELCFNVCIGLNSDNLKSIRLKPGEGIAGKVAEDQQPLCISNVSECSYFTQKIDDISGFTTSSVICVPLLFGGKTLGVLEAINPENLEKKTIALLRLIADYTAIAVENTRRYHKIESLLDQDNLTGLYNTRYMYRNISALISSFKSTGESFSIIFMDIDNFKKIVDEQGHLNGSRAIREVAMTIQNTLMPPEYGVSYAGDEFVIVLPSSEKGQALEKANEIRNELNNFIFLKNESRGVKLSASFGVASYPEDGEDLKDLLSSADRAMFSIKEKGKNGVSGEKS